MKNIPQAQRRKEQKSLSLPWTSLRATAVFTVFIFCLTSVVDQQAIAALQGMGDGGWGVEKATLVSPPTPNLQSPIPIEYGRIEESFQGNSQKTIYYFQDAHGSLEAQENIAGAIQHLVENRGVQTVYEEGYEGEVPTDNLFGEIKDPEVKRKVAYFFLDKLRLGAAEYAHVIRKSNFKLIGADSFKLHQENVKWYEENSKYKEETSRDLHVLQNELKKLIQQKFSKEAKAWLKAQESYEDEELGLLEYLERLKSWGVGRREWGIEKENLVPIPRQRRGSLQKRAAHPPFPKKFPALSLLLTAKNLKLVDEKTEKAISELDARVVYEEIDELEKEVARKLLKGEEQKKIFDYYKILRLLERLNQLKVTFFEFEALREELEKFDTKVLAKFLVQATKKPVFLSKKWELNIPSAIQFYLKANERHDAIDFRMQQFLENDKEKEAVLVFGGFHAESIKRILRKKNISYHVITPKISAQDKKHEAYYDMLMRGENHFYEAAILEFSHKIASLSSSSAIKRRRDPSSGGDGFALPTGRQAEDDSVSKVVKSSPKVTVLSSSNGSVEDDDIQQTVASSRKIASLSSSSAIKRRRDPSFGGDGSVEDDGVQKQRHLERPKGVERSPTEILRSTTFAQDDDAINATKAPSLHGRSRFESQAVQREIRFVTNLIQNQPHLQGDLLDRYAQKQLTSASSEVRTMEGKAHNIFRDEQSRFSKRNKPQPIINFENYQNPQLEVQVKDLFRQTDILQRTLAEISDIHIDSEDEVLITIKPYSTIGKMREVFLVKVQSQKSFFENFNFIMKISKSSTDDQWALVHEVQNRLINKKVGYPHGGIWLLEDKKMVTTGPLYQGKTFDLMKDHFDTQVAVVREAATLWKKSGYVFIMDVHRNQFVVHQNDQSAYTAHQIDKGHGRLLENRGDILYRTVNRRLEPYILKTDINDLSGWLSIASPSQWLLNLIDELEAPLPSNLKQEDVDPDMEMLAIFNQFRLNRRAIVRGIIEAFGFAEAQTFFEEFFLDSSRISEKKAIYKSLSLENLKLFKAIEDTIGDSLDPKLRRSETRVADDQRDEDFEKLVSSMRKALSDLFDFAKDFSGMENMFAGQIETVLKNFFLAITFQNKVRDIDFRLTSAGDDDGGFYLVKAQSENIPPKNEDIYGYFRFRIFFHEGVPVIFIDSIQMQPEHRGAGFVRKIAQALKEVLPKNQPIKVWGAIINHTTLVQLAKDLVDQVELEKIKFSGLLEGLFKQVPLALAYFEERKQKIGAMDYSSEDTEEVVALDEEYAYILSLALLASYDWNPNLKPSKSLIEKIKLGRLLKAYLGGKTFLRTQDHEGTPQLIIETVLNSEVLSVVETEEKKSGNFLSLFRVSLLRFWKRVLITTFPVMGLSLLAYQIIPWSGFLSIMIGGGIAFVAVSLAVVISLYRLKQDEKRKGFFKKQRSIRSEVRAVSVEGGEKILALPEVKLIEKIKNWILFYGELVWSGDVRLLGFKRFFLESNERSQKPPLKLSPEEAQAQEIEKKFEELEEVFGDQLDRTLLEIRDMSLYQNGELVATRMKSAPGIYEVKDRPGRTIKVERAIISKGGKKKEGSGLHTAKQIKKLEGIEGVPRLVRVGLVPYGHRAVARWVETQGIGNAQALIAKEENSEEGVSPKRIEFESPAQLLEVFLKVLSILREMHHREIVHGDIKPMNILVNAKGEVEIIDYETSDKFYQKPKGFTEPYVPLGLFGLPDHLSEKEIDYFSLLISISQMLSPEIQKRKDQPESQVLLRKIQSKFLDAIFEKWPREDPGFYQNPEEFLEFLKFSRRKKVFMQKFVEEWPSAKQIEFMIQESIQDWQAFQQSETRKRDLTPSASETRIAAQLPESSYLSLEMLADKLRSEYSQEEIKEAYLYIYNYRQKENTLDSETYPVVVKALTHWNINLEDESTFVVTLLYEALESGERTGVPVSFPEEIDKEQLLEIVGEEMLPRLESWQKVSVYEDFQQQKENRGYSQTIFSIMALLLAGLILASTVALTDGFSLGAFLILALGMPFIHYIPLFVHEYGHYLGALFVDWQGRKQGKPKFRDIFVRIFSDNSKSAASFYAIPEKVFAITPEEDILITRSGPLASLGLSFLISIGIAFVLTTSEPLRFWMVIPGFLALQSLVSYFLDYLIPFKFSILPGSDGQDIRRHLKNKQLMKTIETHFFKEGEQTFSAFKSDTKISLFLRSGNQIYWVVSEESWENSPNKEPEEVLYHAMFYAPGKTEFQIPFHVSGQLIKTPEGEKTVLFEGKRYALYSIQGFPQEFMGFDADKVNISNAFERFEQAFAEMEQKGMDLANSKPYRKLFKELYASLPDDFKMLYDVNAEDEYLNLKFVLDHLDYPQLKGDAALRVLTLISLHMLNQEDTSLEDFQKLEDILKKYSRFRGRGELTVPILMITNTMAFYVGEKQAQAYARVVKRFESLPGEYKYWTVAAKTMFTAFHNRSGLASTEDLDVWPHISNVEFILKTLKEGISDPAIPKDRHDLLKNILEQAVVQYLFDLTSYFAKEEDRNTVWRWWTRPWLEGHQAWAPFMEDLRKVMVKYQPTLLEAIHQVRKKDQEYGVTLLNAGWTWFRYLYWNMPFFRLTEDKNKSVPVEEAILNPYLSQNGKLVVDVLVAQSIGYFSFSDLEDKDKPFSKKDDNEDAEMRKEEQKRYREFVKGVDRALAGYAAMEKTVRELSPSVASETREGARSLLTYGNDNGRKSDLAPSASETRVRSQDPESYAARVVRRTQYIEEQAHVTIFEGIALMKTGHKVSLVSRFLSRLRSHLDELEDLKERRFANEKEKQKAYEREWLSLIGYFRKEPYRSIPLEHPEPVQRLLARTARQFQAEREAAKRAEGSLENSATNALAPPSLSENLGLGNQNRRVFMNRLGLFASLPSWLGGGVAKVIAPTQTVSAEAIAFFNRHQGAISKALADIITIRGANIINIREPTFYSLEARTLFTKVRDERMKPELELRIQRESSAHKEAIYQRLKGLEKTLDKNQPLEGLAENFLHGLWAFGRYGLQPDRSFQEREELEYVSFALSIEDQFVEELQAVRRHIVRISEILYRKPYSKVRKDFRIDESQSLDSQLESLRYQLTEELRKKEEEIQAELEAVLGSGEVQQAFSGLMMHWTVRGKKWRQLRREREELKEALETWKEFNFLQKPEDDMEAILGKGKETEATFLSTPALLGVAAAWSAGSVVLKSETRVYSIEDVQELWQEFRGEQRRLKEIFKEALRGIETSVSRDFLQNRLQSVEEKVFAQQRRMRRIGSEIAFREEYAIGKPMFRNLNIIDSPDCGVCRETSDAFLQAIEELGIKNILKPKKVEKKNGWSLLHLFLEIQTEEGRSALDLSSGQIFFDLSGRIVVAPLDEYNQIVDKKIRGENLSQDNKGLLRKRSENLNQEYDSKRRLVRSEVRTAIRESEILQPQVQTNAQDLKLFVQAYKEATYDLFAVEEGEVLSMQEVHRLVRSYHLVMQGLDSVFDDDDLLWIHGFAGLDGILPHAVSGKTVNMEYEPQRTPKYGAKLLKEAMGFSDQDIHRGLGQVESLSLNSKVAQSYRKVREKHEGNTVLVVKGYHHTSGQYGEQGIDEAMKEVFQSVLKPGDRIVILYTEDFRYIPIAEESGFELLASEVVSKKTLSKVMPADEGRARIYFPNAVAILEKKSKTRNVSEAAKGTRSLDLVPLVRLSAPDPIEEASVLDREAFLDLLHLLNSFWWIRGGASDPKYYRENEKALFGFEGDAPSREAVMDWSEEGFLSRKRLLLRLIEDQKVRGKLKEIDPQFEKEGRGQTRLSELQMRLEKSIQQAEQKAFTRRNQHITEQGFEVPELEANALAYLDPTKKVRTFVSVSRGGAKIISRSEQDELIHLKNGTEAESFFREVFLNRDLNEQFDLVVIEGYRHLSFVDEENIDVSLAMRLREWGYLGPIIIVASVNDRQLMHPLEENIQRHFAHVTFNEYGLRHYGLNTIFLDQGSFTRQPDVYKVIQLIQKQLQEKNRFDLETTAEEEGWDIRTRYFREKLPKGRMNVDWLLNEVDSEQAAEMSTQEFLSKLFNLKESERLSAMDMAGDGKFLRDLFSEKDARLMESNLYALDRGGLRMVPINPQESIRSLRDPKKFPNPPQVLALDLAQKKRFDAFFLNAPYTDRQDLSAVADEIGVLAQDASVLLLRMERSDNNELYPRHFLFPWGFVRVKVFYEGFKNYPPTEYIRGNDFDRVVYVYLKHPNYKRLEEMFRKYEEVYQEIHDGERKQTERDRDGLIALIFDDTKSVEDIRGFVSTLPKENEDLRSETRNKSLPSLRSSSFPLRHKALDGSRLGFVTDGDDNVRRDLPLTIEEQRSVLFENRDSTFVVPDLNGERAERKFDYANIGFDVDDIIFYTSQTFLNVFNFASKLSQSFAENTKLASQIFQDNRPLTFLRKGIRAFFFVFSHFFTSLIRNFRLGLNTLTEGLQSVKNIFNKIINNFVINNNLSIATRDFPLQSKAARLIEREHVSVTHQRIQEFRSEARDLRGEVMQVIEEAKNQTDIRAYIRNVLSYESLKESPEKAFKYYEVFLSIEFYEAVLEKEKELGESSYLLNILPSVSNLLSQTGYSAEDVQSMERFINLYRVEITQLIRQVTLHALRYENVEIQLAALRFWPFRLDERHDPYKIFSPLVHDEEIQDQIYDNFMKLADKKKYDSQLTQLFRQMLGYLIPLEEETPKNYQEKLKKWAVGVARRMKQSSIVTYYFHKNVFGAVILPKLIRLHPEVFLDEGLLNAFVDYLEKTKRENDKWFGDDGHFTVWHTIQVIAEVAEAKGLTFPESIYSRLKGHEEAIEKKLKWFFRGLPEDYHDRLDRLIARIKQAPRSETRSESEFVLNGFEQLISERVSSFEGSEKIVVSFEELKLRMWSEENKRKIIQTINSNKVLIFDSSNIPVGYKKEIYEMFFTLIRDFSFLVAEAYSQKGSDLHKKIFLSTQELFRNAITHGNYYDLHKPLAIYYEINRENKDGQIESIHVFDSAVSESSFRANKLAVRLREALLTGQGRGVKRIQEEFNLDYDYFLISQGLLAEAVVQGFRSEVRRMRSQERIKIERFNKMESKAKTSKLPTLVDALDVFKNFKEDEKVGALLDVIQMASSEAPVILYNFDPFHQDAEGLGLFLRDFSAKNLILERGTLPEVFGKFESKYEKFLHYSSDASEVSFEQIRAMDPRGEKVILLTDRGGYGSLWLGLTELEHLQLDRELSDFESRLPAYLQLDDLGRIYFSDASMTNNWESFIDARVVFARAA